MSIMKALMVSGLVLGNATANMAIFLCAYRHLAFPYLHEEQRMENAPLIFLYVVPGFLASSICFAVVVSSIATKRA